MEYNSIVEIVIGAILAALGWFSKELWVAIKEVRQDMSKFKEEVPRTYLRRDDFKASIDRIEHTLERIEDKLSTKADK